VTTSVPVAAGAVVGDGSVDVGGGKVTVGNADADNVGEATTLVDVDVGISEGAQAVSRSIATRMKEQHSLLIALS
jgi:hypothetical protein